ncbi:uncharacterized protein LOC132738072 [Ruditapes philippinarum]|uniref:uncharacterized protein LOC132738072 n=1 Tax=Ruditapes philippinarum TaxID=129788 RepID=UPI00295C19EF|nr:uncharacterized protein LOC132738072 [Ruditapes philippinarum]
MIGFVLPLLFVLFWSCKAATYDGKLRNASDGTMEAYMIPHFKSSHASFIEPSPNGDLVMAWFSGSAEGESDVAIVVSRLPNGTDQWTSPIVVSQRKGYSNQNPVLFFDNQTNILYLFHTQQDAKKVGDTGLNGEDSATIWELQSTNNGMNWTSPKIMFAKAGSFDRNRIVISLKNTWLYPIYYAGGSRKDTSYIKESVSHKPFDTWLEHSFTDSDHLVQPTVVRPVKNSTRLVSFFRDRRAEHIYRAVSLTDGVTWTKPSKTTLPNNNSGIEATTLQSGHIAIVYNPTNKERNPIVISVSMDEGLTWAHTRPLDHETGFNGIELSYPTVFQDSQGRIHISYTYNRETIKHKILPNEAWISQRHD